jgi:hypothetical protein
MTKKTTKKPAKKAAKKSTRKTAPKKAKKPVKPVAATKGGVPAPKPVTAVEAAATAEPEHVFALKVVGPKGEAHGGFVWPLEVGAVVKPSRWNPQPFCGDGLHAWLNGEGKLSVANRDYVHGDKSKWLVLRVQKDEVVELDGGEKVKFPRCTIEFVGTRDEAAQRLKALAPASAVHFCKASAGYGGTSTSGYGGTSTSGYGGTSTSGEGGTSTSGNYGTSTSGNYGTSTSGEGGTSTSGNGGTSTSGEGGTSTSGNGGTSTSGDRGILVIRWYDETARRYRLAVGYVGENGIKPNTKYRTDKAGNIVEVPA